MSNFLDNTDTLEYDFGNYAHPEAEEVMQAVTETYLHPATNSEHLDLNERIHLKLVRLIDPNEVKRLSKEELKSEIKKLIEKLLDEENAVLNSAERQLNIEELLDDILGFGPLEKLLRDPSIGDILVNGAEQVYVERNGVLEECELKFRNNEQLLHIIQRIVGLVGRRIDEKSPLVDARLADGSRVNAIVPPLSVRGPTLSIRRFNKSAFRLQDLLRLQMFTEEMQSFFDAIVKAKFNLIITGGTGSGKTTLLNALSSLILPSERIVTIEDSIELQLQQKHVVQLETRPPNVEGSGEVTIRELMRNSLRMRPDRIIIGECRGREALDMMQAMNTGHEGSMTTLHANNPHDALSRLENMVEMSGVDIPLRSLRDQISSAINIVIQVDRLIGGARRVTSVTEVLGMEGDRIVAQELFRFHQQGINEQGHAHGTFEAAGILPHRFEQFQAYGVNLTPAFFQERVLDTV